MYGDSDCRQVFNNRFFLIRLFGIVIIFAVDLFHAFYHRFIERVCKNNELLKTFVGDHFGCKICYGAMYNVITNQ